MLKRRLFLFTTCLAAGAAAASTFFPWWNDLDTRRTDFIQLISTEVIEPTDWTAMSIAMVVYVGAALLVLAGIFHSKLVALIGLLIQIAVVGLWLWMGGVARSFGDFINLNYQRGSWLIAGSIALTLLLLLVRRRKPKGKK